MLAAQELGDADRQARRYEQGEGCTGAQARSHPASHARHRNTTQRRCRGSLIGRRNTVFGRAQHTKPSEAKSLCRDDGSGQADIRVVDAISRCDHAHRRLAGLSSTNPIRRRPLCRSRTEASPRQVDHAKKGLTHRGPLQKPRVQVKKAHELVTTGSPKHSGIPRANGFNGLLRALPGDRAFCHRRRRNAQHCRQFDASVEASGPHDFAVRVAAHPSRALPASIASRAQRP
jgi:hypothetical protein